MRRSIPLYAIGLLTADALFLSLTPEWAPDKYWSVAIAIGLVTIVLALFFRQSAGAGLFLKVGVGAGLTTAGAGGMRWLLIRAIDWYDNFARYAEAQNTESGVTRVLIIAIILTVVALVWKAGVEQAVKPELQRLTTFLVRLAQPQVAVSQPRPAASPIPVHVPPPPMPAQPTRRPTAAAPRAPAAATPHRTPAPAAPTQHALPAKSGRTDQDEMLALLLAMETAKVNATLINARKAKHCNACGHTLPQGDVFFCAHCGAAVSSVKPENACEGCGAQIQDPQQLFCYVCGHSVNGAAPLPAQQAQVSLPVYQPPVT